MPIEIARHAGFCMGVSRAVNKALKIASNGQSIVTYGELVHNPQVVERLCSEGVKVIDTVQDAADKVVIVRSHGVSPQVEASLTENASEIIDLTCPYVVRLHEVVKDYSQNGDPIILVGKANHPEVVGTIGYANSDVYTVNTVDDALHLPLLKRALAVVQTTFPHERWLEILPILTKHVVALTVKNTICTATVLRQKEAVRLASKSDAVLVVGGKTSANTQKLYETCKRYCKRTLLVERATDIPLGFADNSIESIGIAAGASTPDWSLKEVVTHMTETEHKDILSKEEVDNNNFMADVEATLVKIRPGQSVVGTVVQITDDEVCVNIGFKSDGLMKRSELVTENVQLGDEIEVEVVKVNDGEGNVLLSQRNILTRKAFAELKEKFENNEYVDGVGKDVVKGGLICIVNGIRAFVPASLLANRYIEKLGEFVGQEMKLKIIELDEQKRRIVASRRAVVKEENAEKKAKVWATLKEGDVVTGVVRRLTDFGAFVDLGGVDGLIHVTDLSWSHVKHPSEVVSPDQEIKVKVLNLDPERERIQLGLKQLTPKPWDVAPEKYPEGSVVTGKVVRIAAFGAFVELEPGVDGLVHISQCAPTRINKVEDAVSVGQEVKVKVLSVDADAKRISLSIRALLEPVEAETPANNDEEVVAVDIQAVGDALEAEAESAE